MRLKNIPGSRERIKESSYLIKEAPAEGVRFIENEDYEGRRVLGNWAVKGHWHEVFGNTNPVYIEIGMGKGTFLMENARQNPAINYVGIEKYSSVILRAIQKQDEEQLPNVRFLRMDAEYIADVFEKGEVKKIFLNFSDPWPKARHAKRRLTSRQFLSRYARILPDTKERNNTGSATAQTTVAANQNTTLRNSSAITTEECCVSTEPSDRLLMPDIEFKTDNVLLFDFSLEEAKEVGWPILAFTYDLHNDPVLNAGNIMTEYEKKFSEAGQKICKMMLKKP